MYMYTHPLTPLPASVRQNRSRRGLGESLLKRRGQHGSSGVSPCQNSSLCQALAAAGGPSGHHWACTL